MLAIQGNNVGRPGLPVKTDQSRGSGIQSLLLARADSRADFCAARVAHSLLSELAQPLDSGALLQSADFAWSYFCEEARLSARARSFEKAEYLWRAALQSAESFERSDPRLAYTLDNYTGLLLSLDKTQLAETYCCRALTVFEELFGYSGLVTVNCRSNLAGILYKLGRYAQAEILSTQVLCEYLRILSPSAHLVGMAFNNLAMVCHVQGKYRSAVPLYERALPLRKMHLGAGHALVLALLENYASVLEQVGSSSQCDRLRAESRAGSTWLNFDWSFNNHLCA